MNLRILALLLTVAVCKADNATNQWIELSAACQDGAPSVLALRAGEKVEPSDIAKVTQRISKAKRVFG